MKASKLDLPIHAIGDPDKVYQRIEITIGEPLAAGYPDLSPEDRDGILRAVVALVRSMLPTGRENIASVITSVEDATA
jgi:hypothetical protein